MTRLTRRGAVALSATACALMSASSAQAVIQVQRGISGIALGMSPAQVRAGLGNPSKVTRASNEFGPLTQYLYAGGITVAFQGNANVTAVVLTGHTDQTASGVGVRSTARAVKKGVPGVKCQTTSGVQSCTVGTLLPGRRVTDFLLAHGRVNRVTVGFVID